MTFIERWDRRPFIQRWALVTLAFLAICEPAVCLVFLPEYWGCKEQIECQLRVLWVAPLVALICA